jgi:hypothetical protein
LYKANKVNARGKFGSGAGSIAGQELVENQIQA